MGKKYSEVRTVLGMDKKFKSEEDLAYLTHYFQNYGNSVSDYFQPRAKAYLDDLKEKSLLNEADIQYYLPIKWDDIPFPPIKKPQFTFIDLFAGIGGIRLAYQNLGGKCVFTSEWNSFAKKTYEANFGEVPFGDITRIPEELIPNHDLLLAGFPCQPFSIAGVSKKNSLGRNHGFLDETQGTLFFNIANILLTKQPKAFMLENVKNLVSHDGKKTFGVIKSTLAKLGYSIHYKVLDSKFYVPQHRERIIIVGFREDIYRGEEDFKFPDHDQKEARYKIKDVLEKKVEKKYTLTDGLWEYLQAYAAKHKERGNGFGFGLVDPNGISRTISARYYKDGAEVLIPQGKKNPRRLTPRECARLQGFPDEFVFPVSDMQAYKQFGNSVTVPLIQDVGSRLVKAMEIPKKSYR